MKIALASAPVRNRDIDFNVRTMIDCMTSCAGKADLIVFGESVLQGFDALCWNYEADRNMVVSLTDAPIQRLRDAARASGIAVSFGFIQRAGEWLYSSQVFIGADGEIVDLYHRVSVGWKEYRHTDEHYREGKFFHSFYYKGLRFAVGLCGDLWTEGRPEEMQALDPDAVLWPVWCDYEAEEWNRTTKYDYAEQAALCAPTVLLVNPFCLESGAAGGAALFRDGKIIDELPSGKSGILIAELKGDTK